MGLAAWILEKFSAWTGCKSPKGGNCEPDEIISMESLVTTIMIYWSTNTATSSVRFYKEAYESTNFWQVPLMMILLLLLVVHDLYSYPSSIFNINNNNNDSNNSHHYSLFPR